jgi:hypothetical protein
MTDIQSLNNNPLNQVCRELLRQVGEDADPSYLYSLQLAEWVLDKRPDLVPGMASRHIPALLLNAQGMYGWPDQNLVQKLLLGMEEDSTLQGEMLLEAKRLKDQTPEDAGSRLVDILYENLSSHIPLLRSS